MSNWDEAIERGDEIRAAVLAERKRCAEIVKEYDDYQSHEERQLAAILVADILKEPA